MTTTIHAPLEAIRSADWQPICAYADLTPERGCAALVGSLQIALFRTFDGSVFAISNQDPFTGAYVLSRGIVGTRNDVPTVASPLHKQVFNLATGACLDDAGVAVTTYPVRLSDGVVQVLAA
ncbi:MAG: nitrite reductase [Pseudonocardiales bacterium]|nr:nitrite reductase [Pseudonocardiales bacterium]